MSAVKGITVYYDLLPQGRAPAQYPYFPRRESPAPPARRVSSLPVLEADAVILDVSSRERPLSPASTIVTDGLVSKSASPVDQPDQPTLLDRLKAIAAYQKQIPGPAFTIPVGLQVNTLA